MNWIRHGECNGCGDCCRTIMSQAIVRDPKTVVDRPYYDARGFEEVELDGEKKLMLIARFVAPCPRLDGDRCSDYDVRPKTCVEFPIGPVQVVGTPCSYWFERGSAKIGGLGSPHPSSSAALLAAEGVTL